MQRCSPCILQDMLQPTNATLVRRLLHLDLCAHNKACKTCATHNTSHHALLIMEKPARVEGGFALGRVARGVQPARSMRGVEGLLLVRSTSMLLLCYVR